ncbi:PTS transporter subunit EIIC [Enterococcus dispar]|uniref:Uncharacterized protein n=2 Tax=Enterococcus TaxID=1350 RepID=S1NHP4_9ENTE|nr:MULTISPECIES: PTS transporter subunit EIIC [Enterococcus]EOT43309.1 hypothetical protein OMK_00663 [Enterococcus dispar ATCC 51266]EOW85243.1 hypothetical protein I569_00537 [Enterococcus dispar ATCC 51266]OTP24356.1 hypothetical protein A5800_002216 [Enterococcus sp. 5B7_DIV0075]
MSKHTQLAENIIKLVGGQKNIKSLRHCITRLRFELYDELNADTDAINSLDGVITVVKASGQYQVVIGNEVADVYEEINNQLKSNKVVEHEDYEDSTKGNKVNILDKFINFISSLFQPFLGALAAAGMIKGLVAIFGSFGLNVDNSGLVAILNIAGDGFFQFLPIMLAVTAARSLKLNVFSALAIASALLYPTIDSLASGNSAFILFENTIFQSDVYQTFLGLPIILPPGGYYATIIPIIIAIWFGAKIEKIAKKTIPKSVQTFFVPFAVLLIAIPISILIIGPAASWSSDLVGALFKYLYELNTILFGVLIGGLWQLLVMFGLHWGLIPIAILQVVEQGYSPIFGASDVAWAGVMGVLLAVFFKAKDTQTKEITLPATLSSFFGITEPGVYGTLLPQKHLFIIALIASGIGGGYSGYFDVVPYRMGGLGIFSLASYIPDSGEITMNVWHRLISYILTFIIAFIITLVYEQRRELKAEKNIRPVEDGTRTSGNG